MDLRSLVIPPTQDQRPDWPANRRVWPRLVLWGASQILLFLVLFQAYKMIRRMYIPRAESVAFDNALQILRIQDRLNSNFELSWQGWVLSRGDLIMAFNHYYAHYMYMFYACAMLLLVLSSARFLYLRRAFFLTMLLALPWYAIYPLAPPRFMQGFGWDFVDTLTVYGPNYFSETGLVAANRYAAMPSMHIGWTTIAALMIAVALPWRKVGIAVATFMVLSMTVTVIVTGNHYWLDIIGGWLIVAAALTINRALPFPLEIAWPWKRGQPQAVKQAQ